MSSSQSGRSPDSLHLRGPLPLKLCPEASALNDGAVFELFSHGVQCLGDLAADRAEEVALDNLADLDEIMSPDALLHKSCRRVSLLLIATGVSMRNDAE